MAGGRGWLPWVSVLAGADKAQHTAAVVSHHQMLGYQASAPEAHQQCQPDLSKSVHPSNADEILDTGIWSEKMWGVCMYINTYIYL